MAFPHQIHDIAEYFKARLDALAPGVCTGVQLRRDTNSDADLRCYFRDGRWLKSEQADRALAALGDDPLVATILRKKAFVFITLRDEVVEQTQRRVVGGGLEQDLATIAAGQHHVVQFLDPNANKGFHLGHLYEGVLGHAIASACEMAGARVTRQCFVSDIGRSVCEAMAGCRATTGHLDPESAGMKPDHYVGDRYVEFLREYYANTPTDVDDADPVGRENRVRGDSADALIAGWMGGDPEVRALWSRVRGWVLSGQAESVARMNLRVDHYDHGSDMDHHIMDMVRRGLDQKLLHRDDSGAVLYESGKSEYETVVILRSDGFPTEHARQLGHIMHMQPTAAHLDGYVSLMGSEWQHAFAVYEDLVRGLGHDAYHDVCQRLCHGMVIVSGSTMKSATNAVVRWDDFLEAVQANPFVEGLVRASDGALDPRTLATIVIKSFFLSRKVNKPVTFSWDGFSSRKQNPGWVVAEAWARLERTGDPRFESYTDGNELRLLTLFATRLVPQLRAAVASYDTSALVRFVVELSELCVAGAREPSFDALARPTLRAAMRCCGLIPDEPRPPDCA